MRASLKLVCMALCLVALCVHGAEPEATVQDSPAQDDVAKDAPVEQAASSPAVEAEAAPVEADKAGAEVASEDETGIDDTAARLAAEASDPVSDEASTTEAEADADAVSEAADQLASDDKDLQLPFPDVAAKEKKELSQQGGEQQGDIGESQGSASDERSDENLGESKEEKPKEKAEEIPESVGALGEGEAYIPLSPTVPRLTVLEQFNMKGMLSLNGAGKRQFSVNGYADVSATKAGAAVLGGNMHVLNVKEKDEFRFSNTHGQIGGIGFATNFPHYNKASVISSGTKASTKDSSFSPSTIATFTSTGDVGIGVEGPASRLHVQGDGNTRLINVNHWGDVSACASGVGAFAGNAYVTTEGNEAQFRFSNSHSGMGAMAFAVNYPEWNTASVITSGTSSAESKKSFKPKVIATFNKDGFMGVGTSTPVSALDVRSDVRQLSVNDWIDVSSQGSAGFIGLNAHMVLKDSKRFFAFSNSAPNMGAIGIATNFPLINQLSVVTSPEAGSSKGTLFKPESIATFTQTGRVGFGTDAPKAKVDVRHATDRQISANNYADVSANEQLQGFFGGNGYAVGQGFNFANTNQVAGAIGFATHYPKPGEAAIISSGQEQPKAGASFKPMVLAQFKEDGSLELVKDLVVTGDLKVKGRMMYGDDDEYDMMAAQEALVRENTAMRERLTRMESMMAMMTSQ